jgi:hypothetical protein
MGFSMSTDYESVSELAKGDFALVTMQRQSMRQGRIDYDLAGSLFTVNQDLQDR